MIRRVLVPVDLTGSSMELVNIAQGAWRVTELDHGTAVAYELSARPSFAVPEFLLKRLLARDAKQMLEHLHDEIRARGATPAR